MGRFINADAFVVTGQSLLGNNMFAYCANNPVNRIDGSGAFWERVDKINGCLEEIENRVNNWFNNFFGTSASIEHEVSQEIELVPFPINGFISIKKGSSQTTTLRSVGDDSKPVNVYATGRSDNYLLSSVGLQLSASDFNLDISLGLDETGISGSVINRDSQKTIAILFDLSQLKAGLEYSTTRELDDSCSITSYTNVSLTGAGIMALVALMTTGEWHSNLMPSYGG